MSMASLAFLTVTMCASTVIIVLHKLQQCDEFRITYNACQTLCGVFSTVWDSQQNVDGLVLRRLPDHSKEIVIHSQLEVRGISDGKSLLCRYLRAIRVLLHDETSVVAQYWPGTKLVLVERFSLRRNILGTEFCNKFTLENRSIQHAY